MSTKKTFLFQVHILFSVHVFLVISGVGGGGFLAGNMFRHIHLRQMMQRNCFFRKSAISCIQREGSPQLCRTFPSVVSILLLKERIEEGEIRESWATTYSSLCLAIILRAFYTYNC